MYRRLLICLFLLGSPLPAAAQSVQEQVMAQLIDQGFENLQVSRTLLGRVRIVAVRDDIERELVFHPQTGEILRDLWITLAQDGTRTPSPRISDDRNTRPRATSGGGGKSGGGDDDDDDDDEDDDDDD